MENYLEKVQSDIEKAMKMYHEGKDVREVLTTLKDARGYLLNTIDFFSTEAFQKANYTKFEIEKGQKKMKDDNGIDLSSLKLKPTQREKLENFNKVINDFLKTSTFFMGTMSSALGLLVVVASILSLISNWIPFALGLYIFLTGIMKIKSGANKDLTPLQQKVIDLLIEAKAKNNG